MCCDVGQLTLEARFELVTTGKKAINLIAKNNCLDVINWPNHLRVIKVIHTFVE